MSDFKVNSIENKNGNYGPVIAGVSSVNSDGCMKIPSGTTARRVEYIPQSENIVRDGLVLHLDFANPDIFVDGDHVRDLSGAGILGIGTIQGQASFSQDGGGCMEFYNNDAGSIDFGPVLATPETRDNFVLTSDGENRSSGVSTTGTISGDGNDLTVYAWVGGVDMTNAANTIFSVWYSTASSGYLFACNETAADGNRPMPAAIVSDGGDSSGAWVRPSWNGTNIPEFDQRSLNFYQTEASINAGVGNTTLAVDKDVFTNITLQLIRFDGKWGAKSHINGEPPFIHGNHGFTYTSETGDWGNNQYRNIRIGANDYAISSSGSGTWMNGKVAIVMVYNRELSDAEIQQNYNAHRYRFGR
tara:strand:+ start:417 stop:1490 length:1074 start_codon:yes stop_codon:yes gene_type:complete